MSQLLFNQLAVAKMLNLSLGSVEALIRSGQLAHIKIGRAIRVSQDALNEFCKTGTEGKTASGSPLHSMWKGR